MSGEKKYFHAKINSRHTDRPARRLTQWDAILSPWLFEVVRCTKGEDEVLGVIAASLKPRLAIDSTLTASDTSATIIGDPTAHDQRRRRAVGRQFRRVSKGEARGERIQRDRTEGT